jgi:hypothetical protein
VKAAGSLRHKLLSAGIVGCVALFCLPAPAVDAVKAGPVAEAAPRAPSWARLTPDQRDALAPLAGDWDGFDPARKKKWLEIAARYKDLSPEGQQKMHERMPDLVRLTPEQRKTARENFKKAYALPPEKRRELTQQFQDLPEDKKRELAENARKKPAPAPRRPGAKDPSTKPVQGTELARHKLESNPAAPSPAAATGDAALPVDATAADRH